MNKATPKGGVLSVGMAHSVGRAHDVEEGNPVDSMIEAARYQLIEPARYQMIESAPVSTCQHLSPPCQARYGLPGVPNKVWYQHVRIWRRKDMTARMK